MIVGDHLRFCESGRMFLLFLGPSLSVLLPLAGRL